MKLGDLKFELKPFEGRDELLDGLDSGEQGVHRALLKLILDAGEEVFLLPAVLDFLAAGVQRGLLPSNYTFARFEQWLEGDSFDVRARIAGKRVPRDEYQRTFPIGMNRRFEGAHIVTAHSSPDLDTAVASFWSWLDAFAARVASGPHLWNLPGGPTPTIRRLFEPLFGTAIWTLLPRTEERLSLEGVEARTATVSLRDFCNREETQVPAEFEIISVVDHHRSSIETTSFATLLVADVQSCNTLLAEQALAVAARYPIHPQRAIAEYLCYLRAILDDTDLLTRVTTRDVACVADLLNALKTLQVGEETEVIHFRDLEPGPDFAQAAAKRLLQNEELYSLYRRVYGERVAEVNRLLAGKMSQLFADTKEQKGCARVGQTKVFASNYACFSEHAHEIRSTWQQGAKARWQAKPNLELHLQMISTVAGAEEVYSGAERSYPHQDELWIWIPPTDPARERLSSYLAGFRSALQGHHPSLELAGDESLRPIFERHLGDIPINQHEGAVKRLAILRYDAGVITSRKLCVTPYIPTKP